MESRQFTDMHSWSMLARGKGETQPYTRTLNPNTTTAAGAVCADCTVYLDSFGVPFRALQGLGIRLRLPLD